MVRTAVGALRKERDDAFPTEALTLGEAGDLRLIELLFFAYRDFVGEPDRVLARFGFGRAHHRVLHFVNRNPGLTIAGLLDILQITKQSLSRVLKDLIGSGLIEQREGQMDRRQRLLALTPAGLALAAELAALQRARIARAVGGLGLDGRETARRFLLNLIDPARRTEIELLLDGAGPAATAPAGRPLTLAEVRS